MPQEFTDFELRLRKAQQDPDSLTSRHEVEAHVDGSGPWRGEAILDLNALGKLEETPREYGLELYRQIFHPAIESAFRQAWGRTGRVRFRLILDAEPDFRHTIRWERMYIPLDQGEWPVATSKDLVCSRYVFAGREDAAPPREPAFQLLLAISNPEDLPEAMRIDGDAEIDNVVQALESFRDDRRVKLRVLPGRSGVSEAMGERLKALGAECIKGPATIERITAALSGCHGLHLVAHGNFKAAKREGVLFLEDAAGKQKVTADESLKAWIQPGLQLVFLQACKSAAPPPEDVEPVFGLAPKLVLNGVPAVVAMQDFVRMDDARNFAGAFYRSLIRDGVVDAAVNAGRQAIGTDVRDDNWSIPALFLRLKAARLWPADPLRDLVRYWLGNLDGTEQPVPVQVVESAAGVQFDPAAGPAGPIFALADHGLKFLKHDLDTRFVCLTGARGMAKSNYLKWFYMQAAKRFLDGATGAAAPLMMSLGQLDSASSWPRNVFSRIVAQQLNGLPDQTTARSAADVDRLIEGRNLLFLIDGEEDLDPSTRQEKFDALDSLLEGPKRSVLMTFEQGALREWDSKLAPLVWVVRPVEPARVQAYLKGRKDDAAARLSVLIEQRRYGDLAGIPWLLSRMLELTGRNIQLESRAKVMERIAADSLASLDTRSIPRTCAEAALERIAWELQTSRRTALPADELFAVLASVRGTREFALNSLRSDLAVKCSLLAPSGDDGVRFTYPALQSYFAARYLRNSPNRDMRLEDITASLGRLRRLRWWEDTLVMLAGLLPSVDPLLRAILAGSSLVEGEQIFLAARCYVESPKGAQADVVDQIGDTLIWRSHPDNQRPFADRRKSLRWLADMRIPGAIPHLVSMVCDKIRRDPQGGAQYEYSGLRELAVNALLTMPNETTEYVSQHRPDLQVALNAWWKLPDIEPMIELLRQNDPGHSTLAAFGLGQSENPKAWQVLVETYRDPATNSDTLWGITEVFTRRDAGWVTENVIRPGLEHWSEQLCHLVGRVGLAKSGSDEYYYLMDILHHGTQSQQVRAIRALADLQIPEVTGWLRPMCEALVQGDWATANTSGGMQLMLGLGDEAFALRHGALEALRSIGDAGTIAKLRKARARLSVILDQLSFDVAEDIYWRLTGGLAKETYTAEAFKEQD